MRVRRNRMTNGEDSVRMRPEWRSAFSLLIAVLLIASCSPAGEGEDDGGDEPATIESVDGTDVMKITLTELAAERLGIETAEVAIVPSGGLSTGGGALAETSIPSSAVVYDANGRGWTFTSPEPLVFLRARIVVDREVGKVALLNVGPPPGTVVVTVGAQELWGTEFEVGE
jgi:hypothetical protein